jgi:hypothetical protein
MVALNKQVRRRLARLPESGMGFTYVDVTLKDGRRFERVVVHNGARMDLPAGVDAKSDSIARLSLHGTNQNLLER